MKKTSNSLKTGLLVPITLFITAALVHADPGPHSFDWQNLESDIAGVARHVDPNLINSWGMALNTSGNIWVNDNGAGVATVYHQDGTPVPNSATPLVVAIPPSASNSGGANPTGIVANTTSFFKVTKNNNSLPGKFIFVSEDGMISGWNPSLDGRHAIPARDNGGTGAVYKGATMGLANGHNFLYVTNFHAGQVETYDENFQPVAGFPFVDPGLPAGYAPFGIRNLNDQIYVTYAKQKLPDKHDDEAGPGHGFINVFNTHGKLLKRLVSHGNLNSPWGLALTGFPLGDVEILGLFVGNFGDGHINVYNPVDGNFIGTPETSDGMPLAFNGLWDLLPATGGIFFTAGIADEAHGLFGVITSN